MTDFPGQPPTPSARARRPLRRRLGGGIAWLSLALAACVAEPPASRVRFGDLRAATIPQIDDCDDFGTDPLRLDPDQPLNVLVHGCASSSARLQTLAAVFEADGRQAVCFSYDERESLEASAAQLGDALRSLGAHQRNRDFTVLAHSMGGLVARRALVELEPGASQRFRLVAISTPFSGILASRDCGNLALHVLSLGVTAAVCQLVTGSKWSEIPPGSTFTRHPGVLPDNVLEHLQIVTDEAGSCRTRAANGACAQDDFVFSIGEQTNPLVDSDRRVTRVVARVGHSEVIGLEGRPPTLLVGLLREHAVLTAPAANPTTARR